MLASVAYSCVGCQVAQCTVQYIYIAGLTYHGEVETATSAETSSTMSVLMVTAALSSFVSYDTLGCPSLSVSCVPKVSNI